jgi:hypothetical protein
MDDRTAISRLEDWLALNEQEDREPATANVGELYGVLAGVHSGEAGFTGETIDEIVRDRVEALRLVMAHRTRVIEAFTNEVEKVRLGIRQGRLTGDDQLSAVAQVVLLSEDDGDTVQPIHGFAARWVFSERGNDTIVGDDWNDHWEERLWSENDS